MQFAEVSAVFHAQEEDTNDITIEHIEYEENSAVTLNE